MNNVRKTLLVLEGEHGNAAIYQQLLLPYGNYSCTVVEDAGGSQVSALSRAFSFDGILIESDSQEIRSLHILSQIRRQLGEDCPPIVVIGKEKVQVAVDALKAGAADYLVKEHLTADTLDMALKTAIENAELKRELKRNQERFRTSIENMMDCFGIYSAIRDESGTIVDFYVDYVNAAACATNLMSREEQIGQRLCEILPAHRTSGLFEEYCRLVETGEPLAKESVVYEDLFGDQQQTSVRAFDIRAAKHEDGFVASWRDITDQKRTEAALREKIREAEGSRQTLDALMEYLPEGITIADAPDCRIRRVSRYGQHLAGRNADALQDIPVDQHVTAFDILCADGETPADEAALPLTRAIRQGEVVVDEEWVLRKPNGEKIVIACNAGPIFDSQGNITGGVIAWHDVTRRRKLEGRLQQTTIALHQQEERLLQFIHQAPIGIGIGSNDGTIKLANDEMLRLHGCTREEFEQRGLNWRDFVPPESLEQAEAGIDQFNQGKCIAPEEKELLLPDGSRVPIWLSATAWLDDPNEHVAFALDLTQYKRVLANLEASEQRLRQVLNTLVSFVGVLTPDGIVVEINDAAISAANLMPEVVLGQPFEETYWWAYSTDVQAQLRRAIAQAAQGQSVRYDVAVRLGPDNFVTIDFAIAPIFNPAGEVEYLVPSGIDITEQKQRELALSQAFTQIAANERQLQQQLAEIEAIYQNAPIGLNVLDQDLRFVRINERLAEVNGLPVEAHLGRTVREVLPELADVAEQILRPIFETGEPVLDIEIEGETPAMPGVKRVWKESFLPIKDGDRVIGINTVCEEITGKKKSERVFRETLIQLEAAMVAGSIYTWRWDMDANLIFGDANLVRLFNLNPTATEAGLPLERFVEAIHPDDQSRVQTQIRQAIENQTNYSAEFRVIDAAGVERWVLARGRVECDAAGNAISFPGALADITPQKQLQFALRQSEARYRLLFESMEDGFCVIQMLFDDQGDATDYRFLEVNPAFVAQTDLQDVVGKSARQVLPNLEVRWFEIYEQVAKTGEAVRFEDAYAEMDRWFEVYAFPVDELERQKVAVIFRDISDRKRAEAKRTYILQRESEARDAAERANRMKDEFLAILSHELRTPLNPIIGWAHLLRTRQFSPERTAQALETIERNAQLQSTLVDDLLDVARILRGKLKLQTQEMDPATVVAAAIETVQTAANAKQITLRASLPEVGLVNADPARLQQVVWNLLTNAVKFTSEGGSVNISLAQREGQIIIAVTDTGIGISQDFLPYVFESFRQKEASVNRKFGGLGLGLAIVRYLVEAHGGTITADSPGEGEGATFTVSLPLANARALESAKRPIMAKDVDLSGIRIVAVDDSADSLELAAAVLGQYGAEVETFESAAEALRVLQVNVPDVLVTDIGMPEMDGFALLEQVRSLPPEQGGTVPAVALTAYAHDADRKRAFEKGFQKHVAKPVNNDALVVAIAELIAN